jgi:16S rRNA processing protein RimM
MDKKDFYFLGKIIKTSGYNGSLVFFFDVDDVAYYQNLEAVFVELNNQLVPFAIENLQYKTGNTFYVQIEDINSFDQAKMLVGCELYLPLKFLPELKGNQFYFHEVIGFIVSDKQHGKIGIITGIMDQTSQPVFVIKNQEQEIMIPASDEIIVKVDRKNKCIEVNAPEGLIEIYL